MTLNSLPDYVPNCLRKVCSSFIGRPFTKSLRMEFITAVSKLINSLILTGCRVPALSGVPIDNVDPNSITFDFVWYQPSGLLPLSTEDILRNIKEWEQANEKN